MADEVIKNCAVTIRQTQIVAKERVVHRIVRPIEVPARIIHRETSTNSSVTVHTTQILAKETVVHRIVKQTPTPPRVISACKQGPPGPPGETPPAGSFEWSSTNW